MTARDQVILTLSYPMKPPLNGMHFRVVLPVTWDGGWWKRPDDKYPTDPAGTNCAFMADMIPCHGMKNGKGT